MTDRGDINTIWANGRTPVVAVPPKGEIRIRLPYSQANREWLQITQRRPVWSREKKCWLVPRAWLNRICKHAVDAFGQCYLIQSVRETEKCAPACWSASGVDCDCSCRGENHGLDNEDSWFVVNDTFACRSGSREYSVRLLGRRVKVPGAELLRDASGIKWKTYFAKAGDSSLVKIGRSADVQARLKSLQTGCPTPIKLIAAFDGDHEANWHKRFADKRVNGEWFQLSEQDISNIEWIASEWVAYGN